MIFIVSFQFNSIQYIYSTLQHLPRKNSTQNMVRGRAIFTVSQGRCRIIFGTKKRQDSTKIIRPCQKSVRPVGALTIGHSLIELGSVGLLAPQRVQGRSQVGVQGAKPPEAPKILYFTIPK